MLLMGLQIYSLDFLFSFPRRTRHFCVFDFYTWKYIFSRHSMLLQKRPFLSYIGLEALTTDLNARTSSLENVTNEHEGRLSAVEETVDGNICQYCLSSHILVFPILKRSEIQLYELI